MPIPPPPSLTKFESWAEDAFQSSGSGSDVTVNPTRRDERGWDFLVEWDETPDPRIPRDRQVMARTARVQVKSNRQSRPSLRLKLSNAMRFVESNEPCFLVLYWLNRKKDGVEVYGRHFDADLITTTLKRVRQADRDGETDHHKILLFVTMQAEDLHTDDLIPWIRSIAGAHPPGYAKEKAELRESVGGKGLAGVIRLPTSEIESLVEHAVGLRQDFKPDWIDLRETRFGIPASSTLTAGSPTSFNLRVPQRPSSVRFEDAAGVTATFKGVTRSFEIPEHSDVDLMASFTTSHITTRIHRSGLVQTNYSINAVDVEDIHELHELMVLFSMFGAGPVWMTFALEGKSLGRERLTETQRPEEHDLFVWAKERLDALLMATRAGERPRLSVGDMLRVAERLDHFYSCVMADSTTLKLVPKHDGATLPEPIGMIGYCHIRVADTVFAIFYRQPVISTVIAGVETVITFGEREIVERWARKGTLEAVLPMIRKKFASMRNKAANGTIYFDEGDMISAMQGARDIGMIAR